MASTKDQILDKVNADAVAWAGLVGEVPPDRMDEPGSMGEWSFRDLVSHLLAWRNRTIGRLRAAAAGAARPADPWPSTVTEDDPINAWLRDQDEGRSAGELLDAYGASFAQLAAAVRALPDAAFLAESDTPGYFSWRDNSGEVTSDFSGHLEDHAGDVRSWLATA